MRRVFIIQNTPLNEPLPLSVYLTDLLRNFKKSEDFEINLIVGKSKEIPLKIRKLCNRIYQLPSSTYSVKDNLKFSFKVNYILRRENKEDKIDIIHCFYPNSSLLGAVLFKATNPRVKIIYDVRSPWIDMSIERGFVNKGIAPVYRATLYSEERWLCKYVDKFIFITEGLRDFYAKSCGISKKPYIISPSGVDLKLFKRVNTNIRKKYGIKRNEILIGSVGGIARVRKQDELILLFKEILAKNPEIKLMFIGEGDLLEELKKLTKRLHLEKNIIFVGSVPHKKIPKYISAFNFGISHLPDMFIHRTNFSLKILEYLGCGVPVIASRIDSNVKIAQQLPDVYIYDSPTDILNVVSNKRKINVPKNLVDYSWPSLAKNYYKIWGEAE